MSKFDSIIYVFSIQSDLLGILEIGDLHLQRSAQIHVRANRSHESNIDTDMLQSEVLGFAMARHSTWIRGTVRVPSVFRRPTSIQALLDERRYHTRMANTRFLVLLVRTVNFTV